MWRADHHRPHDDDQQDQPHAHVRLDPAPAGLRNLTPAGSIDSARGRLDGSGQRLPARPPRCAASIRRMIDHGDRGSARARRLTDAEIYTFEGPMSTTGIFDKL